MYIDCPICGYESAAFCPIGPNYVEQLKLMVESMGCTFVSYDATGIIVLCPNGHKANYLPTEAKFLKHYKGQ